MNAENKDFVLSTGRRIDVNGNILGIDPDLDTWGGYDSQVYAPRAYGELDDPLTPSEQIELADLAIDLWIRFKARALEESATVRKLPTN